jgi:hypothetical protein
MGKVIESYASKRVLLFLAALVMAHHYYASMGTQVAPPSDLQKQVHELTAQVEQLNQEQGMPATVLNRYRKSIGYIYGVYQVGFANQHPALRRRISGTGFIVGDGLVATNHHLAEPWYGDSEAEALIHRGARTRPGKPRNLLSWLTQAGESIPRFGFDDFGSGYCTR